MHGKSGKKESESQFQARFLERITTTWGGTLVVRLDPNWQQGIPDYMVLIEDKWFCLEFKRSSKAPLQPNQQWFVDTMDEMSFARFVYPENEEEVFRDIQQALGAR